MLLGLLLGLCFAMWFSRLSDLLMNLVLDEGAVEVGVLKIVVGDDVEEGGRNQGAYLVVGVGAPAAHHRCRCTMLAMARQ